MSLSRNTITLLRIPFSLLLMPVFWFGLTTADQVDWAKVAWAFFILHGLVYPASNGYNSFMDRDEGPIGGLEKPPPPSRQLFHTTVVMDLAAVALSVLVSIPFAVGVLIYILFSRLYSWRKVRLKQYPVIGYLTVVVNQGGLVYWLAQHAATPGAPPQWLGMVAACLLIGGFYPLTQVYQHEADARDGVRTISMMLGKQGTFIFCGLAYALAFTALYAHFAQQGVPNYFWVMQLFFGPVGFAFGLWAWKVHQRPEEAGFRQTMRLNMLAAAATNLGFITLTLLHHWPSSIQ